MRKRSTMALAAGVLMAAMLPGVALANNSAAPGNRPAGGPTFHFLVRCDGASVQGTMPAGAAQSAMAGFYSDYLRFSDCAILIRTIERVS